MVYIEHRPMLILFESCRFAALLPGRRGRPPEGVLL
jgi:hypothetical protein